MKAAFLVKNGNPDKAFEIKELPIPQAQAHEVCIQVSAFGLNFADVMARRGLYDDAPAKPCILGYDVLGKVHEVGADVKDFEVGDQVVALTRFGGYAEYATTDARAVVKVPKDIDPGEATALATQYSTAWYCGEEMVHLHEGDHILIQAAAGGVGTALVQLAKNKGCIVYGTASTGKQDYLKSMGVDHPIDYRKVDFAKEIRKIRNGKGLDVVFDSIGGASVKHGYQLLDSGGRIVCYGAADMTTGGSKSIIKMLKVASGFGIHSPIGFLQSSRGMIGVNMLRIADDKPEVLQRTMFNVVDYYKKGIFKPKVGGTYKIDQLAEAHDLLESRKSIGKIVVLWE